MLTGRTGVARNLDRHEAKMVSWLGPAVADPMPSAPAKGAGTVAGDIETKEIR